MRLTSLRIRSAAGRAAAAQVQIAPPAVAPPLTSTCSSIGKGSGSASLSTPASAITSTAPVGGGGVLLLPSGAARPGRRRAGTIRCGGCATSGSRTTTCTTPEASRRSRKAIPPWSRRWAIHPVTVTSCPMASSVNVPASCVRSIMCRLPGRWPHDVRYGDAAVCVPSAGPSSWTTSAATSSSPMMIAHRAPCDPLPSWRPSPAAAEGGTSPDSGAAQPSTTPTEKSSAVSPADDDEAVTAGFASGAGSRPRGPGASIGSIA